MPKLNGIDFLKDKKMSPFSGLIKIRKYFNLDCAVENIFKDLDDEAMAYFEITSLLSWDTFESITMSIKNNINKVFSIIFGSNFTVTHCPSQ